MWTEEEEEKKKKKKWKSIKDCEQCHNSLSTSTAKVLKQTSLVP
jgi:hypothetical protein